MSQLQTLQTENSQLRNAATNNPTPPQRPKTKSPEHPVINTNSDEREWQLSKDSWDKI